MTFTIENWRLFVLLLGTACALLGFLLGYLAGFIVNKHYQDL